MSDPIISKSVILVYDITVNDIYKYIAATINLERLVLEGGVSNLKCTFSFIASTNVVLLNVDLLSNCASTLCRYAIILFNTRKYISI